MIYSNLLIHKTRVIDFGARLLLLGFCCLLTQCNQNAKTSPIPVAKNHSYAQPYNPPAADSNEDPFITDAGSGGDNEDPLDPTPTPPATPTPSPTPTPKPTPSPTPTPTPTPSGGGSGPTIPADPAANPQEAVIILREIDGIHSQNFVVSLAQVFRDGEYFPGKIRAINKLTDAEIPLQVDILRKDQVSGSIRHAMLSFLIANFPAASTLTIRLVPQAPLISPPAFVWPSVTGFNPQVELTGVSGSPDLIGKLSDIVADPKNCNVSETLQGEKAAWRFNGSLLKQCVTWAHMRFKTGGISNEIDLSLRYTVRSGSPSIKVDAVVENTHFKLSASDTTSQFPNYQFGKTIFSSAGSVLWQETNTLDLPHATRWRLLAEWQGQHPDPEVIWDLNYLYQARLFDHMAGSADYNHIDSISAGMEIFPAPGKFNGYPKNFAQTGDAWWIGPNTSIAKSFLATMNRKARRLTESQDSNPINSNYEVYYRQSTTAAAQKPGGPIGVACYVDGTGELKTDWKSVSPMVSTAKGDPDIAHQPRVATTSYVMTGDLFYLETMLFWSMWTTGSTTWPKNCYVDGPSRAVAWSLRNLVDAAYLAPENDPRFGILQTLVEKWSTYWKKVTVDTTAFPQIPMQWTADLTISGGPNWVNSRRSLSWQVSWTCWAFQLAAKRRYNGYAVLRDWICPTTLELYTVEDDPSQDFMITEYNASGQAVTNTYRFPSWAAGTIYLATHLFYNLHANEVKDKSGALLPCDNTNPFVATDGQPYREFVNWGELWYYTFINPLHAGWPTAQNCTTLFDYPDTNTPDDPYLADGKDWSSYNGWGGSHPKLDQKYCFEAAHTAMLEAVYDQSSTGNSTLSKSKAEKAYFTKYFQYVPFPEKTDLIPGVLSDLP